MMNSKRKRNLSDDQKAILADAAIEEQSRLEQKERAKAGRKAGGDCTPEQAKDRLSVDATDKRSQPKKDTRVAVSKRDKISERKLKRARYVRTQAPDLVGEC